MPGFVNRCEVIYQLWHTRMPLICHHRS